MRLIQSSHPNLEGVAAVENNDDFDLHEHVRAVVALAAVRFAHEQHQQVEAGKRNRQLRARRETLMARESKAHTIQKQVYNQATRVRV